MKIQNKTLIHYDKMIEWAKTQNKQACPSFVRMTFDIGESWGANYCPYCHKYSILGCSNCPLDDKHGCCNGLWETMDKSETWEEWIENAIIVRNYIKEKGEIK